MDLDNLVKDLAEYSRMAMNVDQGDYIKDGLIYCGKCNTPKQCRVVIKGVELKPMCQCECEMQKWVDHQERLEKQKHDLWIEERRKEALPFERLRKYRFGSDLQFDERASKVAVNYVKNFAKMFDKGKGLMLYGNVGTGKTFLSACIVNDLVDIGYGCYFTSLPRLVNQISDASEKQKFIDHLNKYDLLVIDDLASERDTEYMNEMVQMVIDQRYQSGKPLIVTTNLTADELKNPADVKKQRLFSRLLEMCIPVEIKGKDRRKEKLKMDYQELEEVLGL